MVGLRRFGVGRRIGRKRRLLVEMVEVEVEVEAAVSGGGKLGIFDVLSPLSNRTIAVTNTEQRCLTKTGVPPALLGRFGVK